MKVSVMSLLSPKPIIARVYRSWRILPGFMLALVEDLERCLWVVESCPAGTQCWTMAQASTLILGPRTHHALAEAVNMGRRIEQARLSRPLPVETVPAPVGCKTISSAPRTKSVRRRETVSAPTAPRQSSRTRVRSGSVSKTLVKA